MMSNITTPDPVATLESAEANTPSFPFEYAAFHRYLKADRGARALPVSKARQAVLIWSLSLVGIASKYRPLMMISMPWDNLALRRENP